MKKYICLLFFIIFLSACTQEPKEDVTVVPEEVKKIEETQMIETKPPIILTEEEKKEEIKEIIEAPINPMKTNRPIDSDKYTKKYDLYFIKYTKREFGPIEDWKWFKAQSVTESALNPKAQSPVGAMCLMQIMPGTWKEIFGQMSGLLSVWDPESNIAAGIYYDKRLHKSWKSPRPENDRKAFMFASYNGGLGNPLKSQKLCLGDPTSNTLMEKNYLYCNLWKAARENAPNVSTWRYEESLHYVDKIMKLMNEKYL